MSKVNFTKKKIHQKAHHQIFYLMLIFKFNIKFFNMLFYLRKNMNFICVTSSFNELSKDLSIVESHGNNFEMY